MAEEQWGIEVEEGIEGRGEEEEWEGGETIVKEKGKYKTGRITMEELNKVLKK